MNPRPHGRKRTRRASGSSMSGYSAGRSSGAGLSDTATRAYAASVSKKYGASSTQYRDIVTFLDPVTGSRKAIGSFQILGFTAANLGFGGEGLITAPVSHVWGKGEYGTGFYSIGEDGIVFTGSREQRKQDISQRAVVARGMTGAQTISYSPAPAGFSKASMGGMGRGEWERPQIPKEDTSGSGIGAVVAVGGIGALLWLVLK